jgi:Tol biopolymer transport system component
LRWDTLSFVPLAAGSRLGRYEIVGVLGAGGMGIVYRARDPRLDRDVAIKLLPDIAEGDLAARTRLLHEARTAASLNHPNICSVYDVGDSDGGPFIAMELMEGETLRDTIRRGRLSPDRVCSIGIQLARALEFAHSCNVVHRDFKSANVMMMPGTAKVMDFGIATREAAPTDSTRTSAGSPPGVAGTIAYMAPEVLQGAAAGVRSDIWSLGVVLHEMASGQSPFGKTSDPDRIAAILRDPPMPLPADLPPGLARVIERCLAKDLLDRPASAGEVALALDIANPTSTGARPVTPASAGPLTPWIAAAAVALAGIAVAAYFFSQDRNSAAAIVAFAGPTQVTTALGVEEFAAWSPDGRTLAYAADPSGVASSPTWDIWVTQPGGGSPINRTSDFIGRDLFPAWSPDGTQIAFWSEREGGGCYVMPALGGSARRVLSANLQEPGPPVWWPDGKQLGCVAGPTDGVLQFVSLETGQPMQQFTLPGEARRTFLNLSQDGRMLALTDSVSSISGDVKRLWIVDLSSAKSTAITDGRSNVVSPVWSPDKRTLYYVAGSGTSTDLWAQAMDTSGLTEGPPRPVTTGVGMRNAALSSDGRKLVYSQGRRVANVWRVPVRLGEPATWADATQLTYDQAFIECFDVNRLGTRLVVSSDRSGSLDLWTMPADGGQMQQLTSDPSAEWCPNWSPDGSTVAFYAYRTGNRDVWTVPATGGAWRQVTDDPGVDWHPGWSSDGKQLLFLTFRGGRLEPFVQPIDGGRASKLSAGNFSMRWSPVDRRIAYIDATHKDNLVVTIADDEGRGGKTRIATMPLEGRPGFAGIGRVNWFPDGSGVLFLGRENVTILGADADGKTPARTLVDLSGRRGIVGGYGTPTDGKFVYFTWQEDIGDLWVMTARDEPRRN